MSTLRTVEVDKFLGFVTDFSWHTLTDNSIDYPRLHILTQSGSIKIVCPESSVQDLEVNLNMVLNGKNNGKDYTCNLAPQYYACSFNKFRQSIYVVNSTYDSKESIYYSQLSIWSVKKSTLSLDFKLRLENYATKDVNSFVWCVNSDL